MARSIHSILTSLSAAACLFVLATTASAQSRLPIPKPSLGGAWAFDGSEPIVRISDDVTTGSRKPTIAPKPVFRSQSVSVRKGASILLPVSANAISTPYLITTKDGRVVATGTGIISTDELPRQQYLVRMAKDPDAIPLLMVVD
jgi:hypothetical protein